MALTQCESCFLQPVESCSTNVTLAVGLTASTAYTVWLQDKFETFYKQDVTSDLSGNIELDLEAVDLSFTPYSGDYLVTVSTSSDTNTTEQLTIATVHYNCINLSFYNSN